MRVFLRPGRRGGRLRALLAAVVAAVVVLTPSPAVAADPVDYQAARFHDGVFAAYMRAHNSGVAGLKNLVLTAELLDWRERNPAASRDDVVRHMVATRQAVNAAGISDTSARTTYATVIKVIDAVSGVPGVSIGTPMVKALLDATIGGTISASAEVEDAVTSAYQNYRWMDALYAVQERAWGQLTRAAALDGDLAAAWDGAIGAQLNVRATATTEQLLADPLLATYINTEAILEHLGNEQAYLAALRTELRAALDRVSGQNSEILDRMAAADLKYPVGPGPKPTPQDYTNALAEAASRQVAIDAAGSAVGILATLAGFADEKAGKEVLAVGKAAISIATAINQYLPTVAGLSLSDAIGSLSTVMLTGNVLGAVMTLAPLFLGSGPTEHELVMQEIGKLREQVGQLRTEMHDRFDRVEAMLTAIYDDVMSIMQRMSNDLGGVIRDLDAIKRQINGLESRVDQLSLSMQEALKKSALGDAEYVDQHVRRLQDPDGADPLRSAVRRDRGAALHRRDVDQHRSAVRPHPHRVVPAERGPGAGARREESVRGDRLPVLPGAHLGSGVPGQQQGAARRGVDDVRAGVQRADPGKPGPGRGHGRRRVVRRSDPPRWAEHRRRRQSVQPAHRRRAPQRALHRAGRQLPGRGQRPVGGDAPTARHGHRGRIQPLVRAGPGATGPAVQHAGLLVADTGPAGPTAQELQR